MLTAESTELVVQFVAAIAALGAPFRVEEMYGEVERRVRELAASLLVVPGAVDRG